MEVAAPIEVLVSTANESTKSETLPERGDRLPEFKFRSTTSIGVRERDAFAHSHPFRFSIHVTTPVSAIRFWRSVPTQYSGFMRTHPGESMSVDRLLGSYDNHTDTPPFPESLDDSNPRCKCSTTSKITRC